MNDMTGEIELLRDSAAGSKDAFGAIVERYQTLVCAVTYSTTGDVDTSEELAPEASVRAYLALALPMAWRHVQGKKRRG